MPIPHPISTLVLFLILEPVLALDSVPRPVFNFDAATTGGSNPAGQQVAWGDADLREESDLTNLSVFRKIFNLARRANEML
ncbi:hypothetical protein EVAR_49675_1 [Eumeta japonica]|uniref:Uncharacterized protein n=1 Tax=Eumeta variegata TaxID=151549 RepID=A0A4C1WQ17_EUMVA|nr:hypothetical protein EVAR_49675_1 [Eumeta japonica]